MEQKKSLASQHVEDIMVTDVLAVHPDTSLIEAAQILTKYNFSGLPVVDKSERLVGLLTEYDLIEKGTAVHLPTLLAVLQSVPFYKDEADIMLPEAKKLLSLKVQDVMNDDPMTIPPEASVEDAVEIFSHHHAINPVPVVAKEGQLVGILARFDIVKLFHTSPHMSELGDVAIEHDTAKENPAVENMFADLQKNFVVVSKGRTKWWPVASILFAIVGFIIAFALILRLVGA